MLENRHQGKSIGTPGKRLQSKTDFALRVWKPGPADRGRGLPLEAFSWTKYTTKLAGMKPMARMTGAWSGGWLGSWTKTPKQCRRNTGWRWFSLNKTPKKEGSPPKKQVWQQKQVSHCVPSNPHPPPNGWFRLLFAIFREANSRQKLFHLRNSASLESVLLRVLEGQVSLFPRCIARTKMSRTWLTKRTLPLVSFALNARRLLKRNLLGPSNPIQSRNQFGDLTTCDHVGDTNDRIIYFKQTQQTRDFKQHANIVCPRINMLFICPTDGEGPRAKVENWPPPQRLARAYT